MCMCKYTYIHMYLFLKNRFIYLMTVNALPACMPAYCSSRSKEMSDILKLELWMVVSNYMGARNQTQFLCKKE